MEKNILVILALLCFVQPTWADDTDIYGVSTVNVKPNVLIIFDNSGSMSTQDVSVADYDPDHDYSYSGGKTKDTVYYLSDGNYVSYSTAPKINDPNIWKCTDAQNALLTKGYYFGKLSKNSTTGVVTCTGTGSDRTLRLGNYHNFANFPGAHGIQTRMEVAKKAIARLVYDNYTKVNFGLMKFNNDEGGYLVTSCLGDFESKKTALIGGYNPSTTVFLDSDQSAQYGSIGGMYSQTWTPLSEVMSEAGRYFAGLKSWFNGSSTGKYTADCTDLNKNCKDYASTNPIEYRCQKNYIILMTDGEPTQDDNAKMTGQKYIDDKYITYGQTGTAAPYIDEVAYFLAHNDLLPIGSSTTSADLLRKGSATDAFKNQTVNTYTIAFKSAIPILQATATKGLGVYYTANNASTLNEALGNIIATISSDSGSFSAAAVPVSQANKAYAGNFIYYGLFQPVNLGNWIGNLKKYGITDMGVITDKKNVSVIVDGVVALESQSYWSPVVDGPKVNEGGAGRRLQDDLNTAGFIRNVYTYTGTEAALTHGVNSFVTSNTTLTTAYPKLTAPIITSIRHEDDDNWPLGSFLHSQPLVAQYKADAYNPVDYSIIYAGASDGMLHAFNDVTGREIWGFIPQDLLAKIDTLPSATSLQHYVDGSPSLYTYKDIHNADKKILIFGERRGGTNYTALDVTNPIAPLFKYQIQPTILGGGTKVLGQSWSKPEVSKILDSSSPTPQLIDAFILAGGYDTNQDLAIPATTDTKGRAIYAINSQTGALQANLNFNIDTFPKIFHSIVAVSPFENPKSRTTTRIYAGDMNGNMLAFRDDIFHRNKDKTLPYAKYAGLYDGKEDGNWEQKMVLYSSSGSDASSKRKIFYGPNILNVNFPVTFTYEPYELDATQTTKVEKTATRTGDYVFYGTGDREHPEDTEVINEFYAIKNNWQWKDDTTTTSVDESVQPNIIKAYVDKLDNGKIKARSDNSVIVTRSTDGKLVEDANAKLFILDITDDLYQNQETDIAKMKLYKSYVVDALTYPSNRGWYLQLVDPITDVKKGEKVVSSPIIFGGVIYFTTYEPKPSGSGAIVGDPCADPGATGIGYLYQIDAFSGSAVEPLYDTTGPTDKPERLDRRVVVPGQGIPPEPVLVVHEGKPSIIVGFESLEPHYSQSVEEFYWRQL